MQWIHPQYLAIHWSDNRRLCFVSFNATLSRCQVNRASTPVPYGSARWEKVSISSPVPCQIPAVAMATYPSTRVVCMGEQSLFNLCRSNHKELMVHPSLSVRTTGTLPRLKLPVGSRYSHISCWRTDTCTFLSLISWVFVFGCHTSCWGMYSVSRWVIRQTGIKNKCILI